jgi:glycosyltransferase involved in cell wall biosynthesis
MEGGGLACLYVGRLAPEKNLDLVVRAFAAIKARRPDARMIWVGSGPALPRLRAAHPDHHFAGSRTGEDLAMHYASADLFLFASLSETWGNVLGEAMASGLGVVADRRAAAVSLIRHGENGLTPPPGDEQAFIEAASALAVDQALRLGLGGRAVLDMADNAWGAIVERLESVLNQAKSMPA